MDFASVDYLCASPFEGRSNIEGGRDEEVSFGVDIAPESDMDGCEAVGEVVGIVEAGVDEKVTFEVDKAILPEFFDESESFVVDVELAAEAAIVVFDGEDGASLAVDDTPFVVDGNVGATFFKKSSLVVLAGDDFVAFLVKEAKFTVARDEDAIFGFAFERGVDGFSELAEFAVVECETVIVAGEEESFEDGSEDFKFDREYFASSAVDHTVAVVVFDHGETLVEWEGILVLGLDEHTAIVIDITIGNQRAVDVDSHHGKSLVERRGCTVLEGNAESAQGVEKAIEAVFDCHDHAIGGIENLVVLARNDLRTVAVDEAAAVIVHIDFAELTVKLVDKHKLVGDDDGAILALKTEAVAVLSGLDAVDEDKFAATGLVVDVLHFVLLGRDGGNKGK